MFEGFLRAPLQDQIRKEPRLEAVVEEITGSGMADVTGIYSALNNARAQVQAAGIVLPANTDSSLQLAQAALHYGGDLGKLKASADARQTFQELMAKAQLEATFCPASDKEWAWVARAEGKMPGFAGVISSLRAQFPDLTSTRAHNYLHTLKNKTHSKPRALQCLE